MEKTKTIHDQLNELVLRHYEETGVQINSCSFQWFQDTAGAVLALEVTVDSKKFK